MAQTTAGVILAGGRAVRMAGARKGLLRIGGKQVIARMLEVYCRFFPEIQIAARESEPYAHFNVPVALDVFSASCSLNGIHTALANVRASHVFVAACDTPFLHPALVQRLLSLLTPESDVIVPQRSNGYFEPLCAIYSKRCLPHIREQLNRSNFQIFRFFPKVRVTTLPEEEIRSADPELASFINVNEPAKLRYAALKAHRKRRKNKNGNKTRQPQIPSVPHPGLICNAPCKRND